MDIYGYIEKAESFLHGCNHVFQDREIFKICTNAQPWQVIQSTAVLVAWNNNEKF